MHPNRPWVSAATRQRLGIRLGWPRPRTCAGHGGESGTHTEFGESSISSLDPSDPIGRQWSTWGEVSSQRSFVFALALTSSLNCNVLVLNRNYLAIRVVNVRRAFSLLCRQLAEVVHLDNGQYLSYDFSEWCELSDLARKFEPDAHDWIRTVRFDLAVPRIIRLAVYDRLPQQTVKFNRRNIYARDGNRCQYCGTKHSTTELSLDHVIPRSQGGRANWENIVCACLRCNTRKGGRTPEQAGLTLITPPTKPRRNPIITIKLADGRYRSWKAFLDNAYWSVELK